MQIMMVKQPEIVLYLRSK